MRTRLYAGLFVACLLPSAARAETSVYAFGGLSKWEYKPAGHDDFFSKGYSGNVGGGAFYNFPIDSRVTVGLDVRAAGTPGDRGGFFAGGALRVGFVPERVPLRPYFQLGGGVVHTTYSAPFYNYDPHGYLTIVAHRDAITSGAAQLAFGLAIRLTDTLDLIAPEYGAQAGPRAGVGYLNGGIVYHLRRRP